MSDPVVVVRDAPALVVAAAAHIANAMRSAIAERGQCSIALSGGSTPKPVYAALAGAPDIEWARVQVYFADERAVAPTDVESNYRMVAQTLLARAAVPPTQVHRMEAERPDIDAAASDYERLLPERFDILCLGMGPDGHTASLFPGHAEVTEARRRVVAVLSAPKPPARRMTVTPPVIASARAVVMMATGSDKAAMVSRALEGPLAPSEVPAQLARRGAWFLDQAAAASLSRPAGAKA